MGGQPASARVPHCKRSCKKWRIGLQAPKTRSVRLIRSSCVTDNSLRPQGAADLIWLQRGALETSSGPLAPAQSTNSIRSTPKSLETLQTNNKPHLRINQKTRCRKKGNRHLRPQTRGRFCQAMTAQELITQVSLIPTDVSAFPPSSLSPLTSIALRDSPRSESSNRLNNESLTLLVQRKVQPRIINETKNRVFGATLDKH